MARMYKKRGGALKAKIALEAIREKRTLAELCKEYGVHPQQISSWKKQLEEQAETLFKGKEDETLKGEIDRLHRVIGQITAERDFLERVLNR